MFNETGIKFESPEQGPGCVKSVNQFKVFHGKGRILFPFEFVPVCAGCEHDIDVGDRHITCSDDVVAG